MYWYVVYTKPRQESRALLNLQNQGYSCYLPTFQLAKLRAGKLTTRVEPLFSRYLFIELSHEHQSQSWAPIRSTLGVSSLLMFGNEPARVPPELVNVLREREKAVLDQPVSLYQPGEKLQVIEGPFAGLEAVYHMDDGLARGVVLIELLNRTTKLSVGLNALRKPA